MPRFEDTIKLRINKGSNKLEEFKIKNGENIKDRKVMGQYSIQRIFKKDILSFQVTEARRLIFRLLQNHPEGLLVEEIAFFTGITAKFIPRRVLINFENDIWSMPGQRGNKIFRRKVYKDRYLYYSGNHAKRVRLQLEKTQKKYEEIKAKIDNMKRIKNEGRRP